MALVNNNVSSLLLDDLCVFAKYKPLKLNPVISYVRIKTMFMLRFANRHGPSHFAKNQLGWGFSCKYIATRGARIEPHADVIQIVDDFNVG